MLNKSRDNTVYLEGGDEPEAIPIETAEYSLYSDERGPWLLLLVNCQDFRHLEIGIPLPEGFTLHEGVILHGVAYDEAFGGWLTNMYYYTHFGVESVTLTAGPLTEKSAWFVLTGTISGSAIAKAVFFSTEATNNPVLRKSFE
jgi:hypothetical protein